jgi:two-component system NtrC family response regulator
MAKNSDRLLLVVEDDKGLQKQFKWGIEDCDVVIAGNREEAINAIRRFQPAVVTLDLGLPPDPANASEGLKALEEILQLAPNTKVIVVTGNDDRDNAVQAVAMGAYDFYQKPVDLEILNLIIQRAFNLDQLEKEKQSLQQANEPLSGMIVSCQKMQDLCRMVEKLAPANIRVLIQGESGTGKEVLAQALHRLNKERAKKRFVAVNCAAIPGDLLESELFGYEKGAFTGANKQTIGKIQYADGGTFFLDEIGDLPFSLQAKLLRFLQENIIVPLGSNKEVSVDVRVICATHQNIQRLVEEGTFREDLYHRISEMVLELPPLREREGDALVIAKALLKKFSEQNKAKVTGFSPQAIQAIEQYDWPGNIREMENKIKRAVILSDGALITESDLGLTAVETEKESLPLNLKVVREAAEAAAIKRALTYCDYHISNTAKILGITRPTLYSLLEKYKISTDEINESL